MSASQPSLVLYQFARCPYCVEVTEYLKRRRIAIPRRDILTDPGGLEELLRIGGKRQVPCLIIDGKALYESEHIIEWAWIGSRAAPSTRSPGPPAASHRVDSSPAGTWAR